MTLPIPSQRARRLFDTSEQGTNVSYDRSKMKIKKSKTFMVQTHGSKDMGLPESEHK